MYFVSPTIYVGCFQRLTLKEKAEIWDIYSAFKQVLKNTHIYTYTYFYSVNIEKEKENMFLY